MLTGETVVMAAAVIVAALAWWMGYAWGRDVGREDANKRMDALIEKGALRWARPEDKVPGLQFIRIVR